jgi:2-polyprenyl-3-methyl-5-hydroxy-6-metoxy-1,4-benzoquinol methylase
MSNACTICGSNERICESGLFDDRFGYPGSFDVWSCPKCRLLSVRPQLKQEDLARLYTEFYPRKDMNVPEAKRVRETIMSAQPSGFSDWFRGKHDAHRFIPPSLPKDSKVLDVGCGEGKGLFEIERRGYLAYGVDPDQNITKIRDALALNIEIGTIEDYRGPDGGFDCIVASQLVEHVIDADLFLHQCRRLLRDKGILILSTPNSRSIWRKIFGRRWIHWHIPYHQRILSPKPMRILLEKDGFKTERFLMSTPTQWSFHQLLSLRYKPVMGQKSRYWSKRTGSSADSTALKKPVNKRDRDTSMIYAKRCLHAILSFCFSVMNRTADCIGIGDCMIVIAKKI